MMILVVRRDSCLDWLMASNATLNKLSVAIFRFVFVNQSTMDAENKDQSEMRTGSGDGI
jgi:hypothetical protein